MEIKIRAFPFEQNNFYYLKAPNEFTGRKANKTREHRCVMKRNDRMTSSDPAAMF